MSHASTTPNGRRRAAAGTIAVLRADPDLAAGIPEPRRGAAVRSCLSRELEIPTGTWVPERVPDSGFGLLVVSGVICRRVRQGQHRGAELIGPGDLLRPWDRISGWSSVATEADWVVVEAARLAVLDADFARRAASFPEISVALARRALLRSRYLAVMAAIVGHRRVETRLVMLFWHLADRFGRTRGEGVDVPLRLTHSLLGELVAARRPTVSAALAHLQEQGVLMHAERGWLLRGGPPDDLAGGQLDGAAGRGAGAARP